MLSMDQDQPRWRVLKGYQLYLSFHRIRPSFASASVEVVHRYAYCPQVRKT